MYLSQNVICKVIQERFEQDGRWTIMADYGEPGYHCHVQDDMAANTPMVVAGYYWLENTKHNVRSGQTLMHMEQAYPRLFSQLEAQGVQFEWHHEWVEIEDKAYRNEGDSYRWQPSWWFGRVDNAMYTLDDGIDELLASYVDEDKAINLANFDTTVLVMGGWFLVNEGDSGLHKGMNYDPRKDAERLRQAGNSTLLVVKEVSQFYGTCQLWAHLPEDAWEIEYDPVQVAYEWHGGQGSALYSYASTGGTVHSAEHKADLLKEIQQAWDEYKAVQGHGPEELGTLYGVINNTTPGS
jgi:hypothetical protein